MLLDQSDNNKEAFPLQDIIDQYYSTCAHYLGHDVQYVLLLYHFKIYISNCTIPLP